MHPIKLLIAALVIFGLTSGLAAQQPQTPDAPEAPLVNGIVVMVNDEPITLFDVTQRERFVLATSGGVENEDQLKILRRRIIETLIDDRLKLQEASQFEQLSDIPEQIFEQQFAAYANSFNFAPEQFAQYLEQIGSSRRTLLEQLRAQFVWDQLVSGLFGNRAAVGEEDVDAAMQRLKDSTGKFEYRLGEIQLIVPDLEEEARVASLARQLYQRIRQGELTFAAAAIQFSQSTSAATGGRLGWITEDQLRAAWRDPVADTEPGTVTEPIRTPGGFTLLFVQDRRRILTADPLDAVVDMRQLVFNFDQSTTQSQVEGLIERAAPLLEEMDSCQNIPDVIARSGFARAVDVGSVTIRDLPPQLRRSVLPLKPGQATRPILTSDSIMALAVCDKQEPQVQQPAFEDIQNQLEGERLAAFARRYLRDLKRDAVIDYRIAVEDL